MTKSVWRGLAAAACLALLWRSEASAVQESRPVAADPRIRVITYDPNGVHKYVGHYTFQGSILFGEKILTVSLGNQSGWNIMAAGSRLFMKPIAMDPAESITNMMVITEKRTYYFQIEARTASGPDDPDLAWEVRFIYPEGGAGQPDTLQRFTGNNPDGPDLTDLSRFNFNYTVSGNEYIAPIRIFDDGEFTYLEYPEVNADIPAVFVVDSDSKEATVNYHAAGKYVVVQRVAGKFTLRHGNDVVCVFNESFKGRASAPQDAFMKGEKSVPLGLPAPGTPPQYMPMSRYPVR